MCAITTIGLVVLTWFALKERYYSAVMAATGLLYLAILTAFGTDLVARRLVEELRPWPRRRYEPGCVHSSAGDGPADFGSVVATSPESAVRNYVNGTKEAVEKNLRG